MSIARDGPGITRLFCPRRITLPGNVELTRRAAFGVADRGVSPLSSPDSGGRRMKLSPEVDLGRSLRQVFGNKAEFTAQIEQDCERQSETANAILRRFFGSKDRE